MYRPEPGARRGIILLVISGMVALLLLLAMSFLQLAQAGLRASGGSQLQREVSLAASSGLEYAAARLTADPFPVHGPDATTRGDDWTFRDPAGTGLSACENPSYARGEPWRDVTSAPDGIDNDGDGEIDEGEWDRIFLAEGLKFGDRFLDLDGDGRHSAWSGRLRGGSGGSGARFALKVESSEGKVPLNAGENPPAADPCLPGLIRVIDHLGSLPFGAGLLGSRPAGGYRSWSEVKEILASLGCPKGEMEALCAHLTLERCLPRGEGGRCEPQTEMVNGVSRVYAPRYAPINLWCASGEVLEALFRDLQSPSPVGWVKPPGKPRVAVLSGDFPAEQAGRDRISPFTGGKFLDMTLYGGAPYTRSQPIQIFQPEAARLSEALRVFRQGRERGWLALRKLLHEKADRIFREDFDAIAAAPADVMKWTWVAAKANLAFQGVAVDAYPGDAASFHPSRLWATWGIDANPSLAGIQPAPSVSLKPGEATLGLTLSPPSWFEVACRGFLVSGADAVLSGMLRTGDVLELHSQEDFERLDEARELASIGIDVLDDPIPAARKDGAAGFRPNVVTLPEWDRRSDEVVQPGVRFPFVHGEVGPAPAEVGALGSALLYWSFTQDFDGKVNGAPPPAWNELWTVYGANPSPPWEPPVAGSTAPPPYRLSPQRMAPYGVQGEVVGMQMPGMIPRMRQTPFGQDNDSVKGLSVEAWIGVNGSMDFGWFSLTAKRGFRSDARTPGTEFVVFCGGPTMDSVTGARGPIVRKTRAWLVKDPPGGAAWSRHVLLTLRQAESGLSFPKYKTEVRLRVDGSDASEDGVMAFLLDGTESHPGDPTAEIGEMIKYFPIPKLKGVDEVRLYGQALDADPDVPPRYVHEGVFLSPLYSLDVPGKLSLVQWTGVAPAGASSTVLVQGCLDPGGAVPAGPWVQLGDPTEITDLAATYGMPEIRSFRYKVVLESGSLAEPPLFESIWLLARRRGVAPSWTGWSRGERR